MKEQPFHSLPIKKNKNKNKRRRIEQLSDTSATRKNMKKICLLLNKNNKKIGVQTFLCIFVTDKHLNQERTFRYGQLYTI